MRTMNPRTIGRVALGFVATLIGGMLLVLAQIWMANLLFHAGWAYDWQHALAVLLLDALLIAWIRERPT